MLETLYQVDKKKKVRFWKVWTEGADVVSEYGEVGGKTQIARETCIEKNIGKTNYMSPENQAIAQAKSQWQKKLDNKYFLTVEEASQLNIMPMLAQEFEEKRLEFPCYVNPKFDGFRMLAYWKDNEIKLMSRGQKEYTTLNHIKEGLKDFFDAYYDGFVNRNLVLDGEVYLHGVPFQEFTRLAKKYREGETEKLKYYIYDIVDLDNLDRPFSERFEDLKSIFEGDSWLKDHFVLVDATEVNSLDEINKYDQENIANGFEGSIIRLDKPYEFSRTHSLLKLKQFEDAEFKIVDYKLGVGKFEGVPTFILQNDITNNTFDAVAPGNMEEKASYLANPPIGKLATIKFFGRSEELKPRFPVCKGIRLEIDLDES